MKKMKSSNVNVVMDDSEEASRNTKIFLREENIGAASTVRRETLLILTNEQSSTG